MIVNLTKTEVVEYYTIGTEKFKRIETRAITPNPYVQWYTKFYDAVTGALNHEWVGIDSSIWRNALEELVRPKAKACPSSNHGLEDDEVPDMDY